MVPTCWAGVEIASCARWVLDATLRRVDLDHAGRPDGNGERRSPSVLVVGTDDWALDQGAAALDSAGMQVLRCHEPGAPAFPCNALIPGGVCPLDAGFDVVLTTRARPTPTIQPGEIGVVCALRTGRPLVVAGAARHNPFADLTATVVAEHGDVVTACRSVIESAPTR